MQVLSLSLSLSLSLFFFFSLSLSHTHTQQQQQHSTSDSNEDSLQLHPLNTEYKTDVLFEIPPLLRAPSEWSPLVLFVGGGPVGMWTAIQLKILCPHWKIQILEKYGEYQRKHVLRLSKSSFQNCTEHELLKDFISSVLFVSLLYALSSFDSTHSLLPLPLAFGKTVRTSELEKGLKGIAEKLSIPIKIVNIASIDMLIDQFPEADVVVGSDGSHSVIRRDVFQNKMKVYESLQCIVDIKYEVYGAGRALRFIDQVYPTLKVMKFIGEEAVGKPGNDNITPITLRLLIDKDTFDRVKEASFKNPFNLATHKEKIGADLMESITIWMNAKAMLCGEKRVPGSEKLTVRVQLRASCEEYWRSIFLSGR